MLFFQSSLYFLDNFTKYYVKMTGAHPFCSITKKERKGKRRYKKCGFEVNLDNKIKK